MQIPDEIFEGLLDQAEAVYELMLKLDIPLYKTEHVVAEYLVKTQALNCMSFDAAVELMRVLTHIIYHIDACDRVN